MGNELYLDPILPTRGKDGRFKKGNQFAKGNTWDKIYDEDTRIKQLNRLREISLIKGLNTSNRPIQCSNGKVYPSAAQAAIELGLDSSHITACCKGKRYTTGGLRFEYYYED